jgi:hypothetical protein
VFTSDKSNEEKKASGGHHQPEKQFQEFGVAVA